jgi:hypothetical protein
MLLGLWRKIQVLVLMLRKMARVLRRRSEVLVLKQLMRELE